SARRIGWPSRVRVPLTGTTSPPQPGSVRRRAASVVALTRTRRMVFAPDRSEGVGAQDEVVVGDVEGKPDPVGDRVLDELHVAVAEDGVDAPWVHAPRLGAVVERAGIVDAAHAKLASVGEVVGEVGAALELVRLLDLVVGRGVVVARGGRHAR